MKVPICSCGQRTCEKFGGKIKGYRSLCWKCRQYSPNPNLYKERKRKNVLNLKQKAINGYGGKCQCCGEKEICFLTIDHVNNDGSQDRKNKNIHGGAQMFSLVIKENFPTIYQVLCFNCNCGKHINGGICPHKK